MQLRVRSAPPKQGIITEHCIVGFDRQTDARETSAEVRTKRRHCVAQIAVGYPAALPGRNPVGMGDLRCTVLGALAGGRFRCASKTATLLRLCLGPIEQF